MKDYEYAVAPTSQFFFCGVPFRLDIRPKCNLNCVYCFAMSRGGRRTSDNQIINVSSFERRFESAFTESGHAGSIVSELLNNRVPIHLGGMSDPFSDEDTKRAFDRLVPLFCDSKDYPLIISTKKPSEIITRTELLHKQNLIVQVSLPIVNQTYQQKFEPSADSVDTRLSAMRKLIDMGVNVTCRIQPIIPQLADSVYGLIDALSLISCRHVIFEFLKLPVEKGALNTNLISDVLCTDILEYYKQNGATLIGREWLLPIEYRHDKLMSLKEYANSMNISASLADYGLYHLGDTRCCCGVDLFNLDCTWIEGNYSTLLHDKCGLIYFTDLLQYWHPEKSMAKYINSKSRLQINTMIEHQQNRWNHPGTANAPDCYWGVEFTGEKDQYGNCIYCNSNIWEV